MTKYKKEWYSLIHFLVCWFVGLLVYLFVCFVICRSLIELIFSFLFFPLFSISYGLFNFWSCCWFVVFFVYVFIWMSLIQLWNALLLPFCEVSWNLLYCFIRTYIIFTNDRPFRLCIKLLSVNLNVQKKISWLSSKFFFNFYWIWPCQRFIKLRIRWFYEGLMEAHSLLFEMSL